MPDMSDLPQNPTCPWACMCFESDLRGLPHDPTCPEAGEGLMPDLDGLVVNVLKELLQQGAQLNTVPSDLQENMRVVLTTFMLYQHVHIFLQDYLRKSIKYLDIS